MELFAQESVQKHDALVKRIRKEVAVKCLQYLYDQITKQLEYLILHHFNFYNIM